MLVNIPYVDPYGMCIHLEINPRKPTWITENEAPGRGRIPFGKHHFPGSFLGASYDSLEVILVAATIWKRVRN